jgi:hypothetical protein
MSGKDVAKSSVSASGTWYAPPLPPRRSSSSSSTVVTLLSFGVANMSASSPSRARSRARKLEASPLAGRSLTPVWPEGNVSGLTVETVPVRTSVKLVERWESVRHFGMGFSALGGEFCSS